MDINNVIKILFTINPTLSSFVHTKLQTFNHNEYIAFVENSNDKTVNVAIINDSQSFQADNDIVAIQCINNHCKVSETINEDENEYDTQSTKSNDEESDNNRQPVGFIDDMLEEEDKEEEISFHQHLLDLQHTGMKFQSIDSTFQ